MTQCSEHQETGVPHRVTEDDIHDGYRIPKGALVIVNLW
jgi:cytochrome P450